MSAAEGRPQRGLRVNRGLVIPPGEITVRVSRSSGPGGQHANVTASRVEASFDVLASTALSDAQRRRVLARAGPRIVAIAQDERSQARNRELALDRLGERLAQALVVPKRRRPTRPTPPARGVGLVQKLLDGSLVQAPQARLLRMEADRVPKQPGGGRPGDDHVCAQH